MSTHLEQSVIFRSISDVERDTGLARETLRVWERRYAFPQPARDARGERAYPPEQVQRLQLVKRLLDQGYRPGKIVHYTLAELTQMAGKSVAANTPAALDDPELQACLELVRAHQMVDLRRRMAQAILQGGLHRFVTEVAGPLTTLVGQAWAQGQLAVFEEHLYAESLQSVLRAAISAATQHASADAAPRIVLTTVQQERHGLGLLMAEALFALEGACCISLGLQTPLAEIIEAARTQRADIVALSFSAAVSPRSTLENVGELKARLPQGVLVWAGGAGAALARRQLGAAHTLDLSDIGPAVAQWRAQRD